jgi:hypothetical protein
MDIWTQIRCKANQKIYFQADMNSYTEAHYIANVLFEFPTIVMDQLNEISK